MSLERRGNKLILRAAGFGVGGILMAGATSAALHPNNTYRIFEAAVLRESVNCDHGVKASNTQGFEYDAIAVPGAGRTPLENGEYFPNFHGQLRLDAAALAFSKEHKAPVIALLDGDDKTPEGEPIGKAYLGSSSDRLLENPPIIPGESIVMDHVSINTATNMKELGRLARENDWRKVLIITNKYHGQRATLFACQNGVHASQRTAESIIRQYNPGLAPYIKMMYDDPTMRNRELTEGGKIAWSLVDPKGVIPTIARKKGLR